MSACVKHTKDHTSYCVLQKFCKVSAGGVPIVNEMDCPLLQATDRFYVVPSVNVIGSITIIHECSNSCGVQQSRKALVERETITILGGTTFKHDVMSKFYSVNTVLTFIQLEELLLSLIIKSIMMFMLYTGPVSCCTLDLYHVASTCCRDLSLKHPDQHVYTGVGPCWYMLIRYWEELAV